MHLLAPAKINLHLRVGPLRADGFHPLLSWMTTVGLCDKITLAKNPVPGQIVMTCTDSTLPCDDTNLVIKAARLLANPGDAVSIHLEKQIPHGGGLGGGSSDAAFTLMALNRFWDLKKNAEELTGLAGRLGSDVPFFLFGPSSNCRGRGEVVRPIQSPAIAKWVVLILPALSMPTPAVYRQFDAMKAGRSADIEIEPDWNQWAALPSQDLLLKLVNDLEPPAFAIEPKLGSLRAAIEKTLDRPVRMSGSGSSLFTLFDEKADAANAARRLTARHGLRAVAVELAPKQSS